MLKVLKWIGLSILTLIIIGLLWVFGVPWFGVLQDHLSSGKYKAYLESNYFTVEAQAPVFNFDDDFYDHKVFMLAEMHGYAGPQALDLALVRHLNAEIGMRHYLAELSPAQAIAFNIYLQTGDETWVRDVFDYYATQTAQWGSKEFFAKLGEIRALNQGLPEEQHIRFVGVDKVYDDDFAQRIVAHVMAEDQTVLASEALPSEMIQSEAVAIRSAHALNLHLLEANAERDVTTPRYGHILPNIDMVFEALPADEKFYGLWGLFHGMQTPVNDAKPLAYRLEQRNEVDEVATIGAVFANGSTALFPANALPDMARGPNGEPYTLLPANNDDVFLFYTRGIGDLKAVAGEAEMSLFNLRGDKSPYFDTRRLVAANGFLYNLQPFEVKGPTADAMDYIVLFQGSPALTPWKGEAFDITQTEGP